MPEGAQLPVTLALGVLFLTLAISVVTDLRKRLIYNWVTFPALAVEFGIIYWFFGWPAVEDSLIGMAVCAGPLLIASLRGWVGMGDVKLMAVVGAVAGWPSALLSILFISIAGGVQAAAQLIWARVRGQEKPRYVPYGVAIAAGTIWSWWYLLTPR